MNVFTCGEEISKLAVSNIKKFHSSQSAAKKYIFKIAFLKKVKFMSLIYSPSESSHSSEEEKSLKLSLTCLITFLSMYLHSFKNTCG